MRGSLVVAVLIGIFVLVPIFCDGLCVSGDCIEWNGRKSVRGSQTVSPRLTSTYQLTCTGIGSATARVTIEVRTIRWREIIPRLFPFLNLVVGMAK
jgi:hypothetical protein